MLSKKDTIAFWFELHGPGLKARGIKWQYYFDTNTYSFWREVECTAEDMQNADSRTAVDIITELTHG